MKLTPEQRNAMVARSVAILSDMHALNEQRHYLKSLIKSTPPDNEHHHPLKEVERVMGQMMREGYVNLGQAGAFILNDRLAREAEENDGPNTTVADQRRTDGEGSGDPPGVPAPVEDDTGASVSHLPQGEPAGTDGDRSDRS